MVARYARVYPVLKAAHLDRLFDYAIPDDLAHNERLRLGTLVSIDFHGLETTGWVMEVGDTTEVDPSLVKPVVRIANTPAFFDPADAAAWQWLAKRFASSFSAVSRAVIPDRVKFVEAEFGTWPIVPVGTGDGYRPGGEITYLQRGWHDDGRADVLVHIQAALDAGYQAQVTVPTPEHPLADAVVNAFGPEVIDERVSPRQADRYRSFWRWRLGLGKVLVGTRLSTLWPAHQGRLGLIVVADEANPAHKMERSPRAHVREAALIRASTHNAQVLITSGLPSGQLTQHIQTGHVHVESVSQQQHVASSPRIQLVDRNTLPQAQRGRFSAPVLKAIGDVLQANGRVIVLGAMKGTGRSIGCRYCHRRIACPECAGGLDTPNRLPLAQVDQWECRVCGWQGPPFACPACDKDQPSFKQGGVQGITTELSTTFPGIEVVSMEGYNQPGPTQRPAIAVMTRGSVVPNPAWLQGQRADLGVIVDPDVLLGRAGYDAAEDALRLWTDLAFMCETVMVQSYEPDHHAIQAFAIGSTNVFWDRELPRRTGLGFPPTGHVIRFAGLNQETGYALHQGFGGVEGVMVFGPDADGGAFLTTRNLRPTLDALLPLRDAWARADLKIQIDVDSLHLSSGGA